MKTAAAGFILLVVFAPPSGGQHAFTMPCPTMACVAHIEKAAERSPFLAHFAVFARDRYARFPDSGQTVFPPLFDWQPM